MEWEARVKKGARLGPLRMNLASGSEVDIQSEFIVNHLIAEAFEELS
jgi:hypothetical protein